MRGAERGVTLLEMVFAIWLLGLVLSSVALLMMANTRMMYDLRASYHFRELVEDYFNSEIARSISASDKSNLARFSELETLGASLGTRSCLTQLQNLVHRDQALSRVFVDVTSCTITINAIPSPDPSITAFKGYEVSIYAEGLYRGNSSSSSDTKRVKVRLTRVISPISSLAGGD